MSARYAVYLAPAPDSAWWRFGSRVLGRDAASGEPVFGYAPYGMTAQEWRARTSEPRRYGFHATLKAPFRLAQGRSLAELEGAVAGIAASTPAFDLGPLRVAVLGAGGSGFVALTPLRPPEALASLEARAVRELDAFRAPPSADEIARRRPERLSARQRAYLSAWGYPFVLDEFRLHFTLTDALPSPEPLVAQLAADCPADALKVDALVLFAQEPGADFRVLRRFEMQRYST